MTKQLVLLMPLLLLASCDEADIPGCHNQDWSCPEDTYCSETKKRCWPCKEIADHYCASWTTIQERFKECASYCIKMKLQKKDTELNETQEQLVKEREIQKNTTNELREAKEMLTWKDKEIEKLNRTMQNLEVDSDESEPYLPGFVINLLVGAGSFVAGGSVVCIWKKYRKKSRNQDQNGEQDMPLVEQGRETQETQTLTIVTHPTAPPDEDGYGSASTVTSSSNGEHQVHHAQQMTGHDSNPQLAI